MHDFSISQQIANQVIKKAGEQKASQVLEVKIKIGELTHLNPEQLDFWLKEFFRETIAQKAKIRIEKIPLTLRCKDCGYQGKAEIAEEFYYYPLFTSICCPRCSSTEVEIKSGRECLLEKIRIKR